MSKRSRHVKNVIELLAGVICTVGIDSCILVGLRGFGGKMLSFFIFYFEPPPLQVLSPSRLQAKTLPVPSKKAETLSPPDPNFSPDPGYPGLQAPNLDSTSPFSESWPSTERSSSTPEGGSGLPTAQASETKTLAPPKPPESASDSESVIAR